VCGLLAQYLVPNFDCSVLAANQNLSIGTRDQTKLSLNAQPEFWLKKYLKTRFLRTTETEDFLTWEQDQAIVKIVAATYKS